MYENGLLFISRNWRNVGSVLCWHGFFDVSVTLSNVHPRSDSKEMAEAFLIGQDGS